MAAAVMVNSNGNSAQPSSSSSSTLNAVAAAEEGQSSTPASGENGEEEPVVDIVINNVVCSFNVRCHLNLRDIALRGLNVEYRKENGMVMMKLRHPYTTASMWSSGKITCTGASSEDEAKTAARKYARFLQKLGFNCRFRNYRVVNVLGTCTMPFAIKITQFSQEYKEACYEPELHPGVTYRIRYPKATLKIFSTGSITITAPCVANVESAVKHIFPLVYAFRKPKSVADLNSDIEKYLAPPGSSPEHFGVKAEDENDGDEAPNGGGGGVAVADARDRKRKHTAAFGRSGANCSSGLDSGSASGTGRAD